MAQKKKAAESERVKLTMPEKPIDQYKIEWWTVDTHGNCASVRAHHAIYHVNTKWADLYPGDRPGCDFENHWQIFQGERFEGRTGDGWREPWSDWLEGKSKDRAFFARRDAVAYALELNLRGIEFVEEKLEAHRAAIAAARAELGVI